MSAPVSFRNAAAFRAWLRKNHKGETALLVRIYKVHATERGMIYSQALDEALCFGWIDGVRRGLDADSFTIRFSPRKPRSIWSRINVAHVARLIREGRMEKPGLAAFEARSEERTGVYSFERAAAAKLTPALERRFKAVAVAWKHFQAEAPWYRRTTTHWIMSGKKEETQLRRLDLLIDCSRKGVRIPALRREPKEKTGR
jgi:uncharacterized protein YdeI (YjbR/CyaY-like superfamily)